MVVTIRFPDSSGDVPRVLAVQDAKPQLGELLQKGWLMSINGAITKDLDKVVDGSEVKVFPSVGGG